jgi:hypothetical protein
MNYLMISEHKGVPTSSGDPSTITPGQRKLFGTSNAPGLLDKYPAGVTAKIESDALNWTEKTGQMKGDIITLRKGYNINTVDTTTLASTKVGTADVYETVNQGVKLRRGGQTFAVPKTAGGADQVSVKALLGSFAVAGSKGGGAMAKLSALGAKLLPWVGKFFEASDVADQGHELYSVTKQMQIGELHRFLRLQFEMLGMSDYKVVEGLPLVLNVKTNEVYGINPDSSFGQGSGLPSDILTKLDVTSFRESKTRIYMSDERDRLAMEFIHASDVDKWYPLGRDLCWAE